MLALVVVPHALRLQSIGESCDIDAAISGAGETQHLCIELLQAVVRPLLDEVFPLVCGIQKELLLWRDLRAMRDLCGSDLHRRLRRS